MHPQQETEFGLTCPNIPTSHSPLLTPTSQEQEEKERKAREAEERALDAQQLRVLWRYGCPVVKGQNVTCTAWNRHNEDILAVGYGCVD